MTLSDRFQLKGTRGMWLVSMFSDVLEEGHCSIPSGPAEICTLTLHSVRTVAHNIHTIERDDSSHIWAHIHVSDVRPGAPRSALLPVKMRATVCPAVSSRVVSIGLLCG